MTDPARLLERLDEFRAFARKRLGDPELAADAVQESFRRALAKIDQLDDDERLVAWFFRILRNVIADLASRRTTSALADDLAAPAEEHAAACRCVARLIDDLPGDFAQALRSVELEGKSMDEAAADAGISVANLKVRRFRARAQLRDLVDQTCRMCARHGCLDCTCAPRRPA